MSIDPNNIHASMNAGVLEGKNGNIKTALQYLNKVRSLSPNDFRVYLNIGNVYLKDQNFKSAIQCYKEALQLSPNNLKILKPYIISLSKLEFHKELEEICKLTLSIDKKNPLALACLTRAMKENEKYEKLEKILNRVNSKLELYETRSNKKEYTRQEISKTVHKLKKLLRGKIKEARRNRILNRHNISPEKKHDKHIDQGGIIQEEERVNDARYSILDRPTGNLETIEQGIRLRSNMAPSRLSHAKRKDTQKFSVGLLDRDPKDLEELLKNEQDNKEVLFALGCVYNKRLEFRNSEEVFNKLFSIDSKFRAREVNEKLGDIQFKFYKKLDKALEYFTDALKYEQSPLLHIKIGRCYERKSDLSSALKHYKKSIELSPNFLWGLFHIGCANSKLGNKSDALFYLKKAYDIDKDNTDVIAKFSEELIMSDNQEDTNLGLEILKKAKSNYIGNIEIMFSLAKAHERRGNIKEAISVLEEANTYSEFYSDPNRLYLLALLYEKEKFFSKATQIYKTILTLNKEHTQALMHIGFILQNAREYKRAHKYFKFALKIDPNLSHAHYGIAKIYQKMKSYDEAMDHYQKSVLGDPGNQKAFFQMGVIYLDQGKYQQAKEMFEKSLELDPEFVLSIVGLGDVLYELGDYHNSEKYHKRAFEIADLTKIENIQVIISYANSLSGLQRYGESITLYKKALSVDSELSEVHFLLANTYLILDKCEEAIAHYVTSIKMSREKEKPEAYFNLANSLCNRYRHKEAIKCYKKALKLDPNIVEAYYNLANTYHMMGNYKKSAINYDECVRKGLCNLDIKFAIAKNFYALTDYSKCEMVMKEITNEDPKNVKLLMYYGILLEKNNKLEEAAKVYEKILVLEPKNFEAKINLQQIKEPDN
jgi:tetratricopeptide (TPR) repeat protein